jgi:hypothetical protein
LVASGYQLQINGSLYFFATVEGHELQSTKIISFSFHQGFGMSLEISGSTNANHTPKLLKVGQLSDNTPQFHPVPHPQAHKTGAGRPPFVVLVCGATAYTSSVVGHL